MEISDEHWHAFFTACASILGPGAVFVPEPGKGWCSWTTFSRLRRDAGYWTQGVPDVGDLKHWGIGDGGVWGQPFEFSSIAHIIVPRYVSSESLSNGQFKIVDFEQPVDELSAALEAAGVGHAVGPLALEIKLY